MKASDLMIGDWVNVTAAENIVRPDILSSLPKKGKVVGIDCDCIYVDFVEYPFMLGDIEPIPITSEILEKNGFVYNAIPFMDGWEQFGLILYRGGDGYRIDCGINESLIIDFVHELQHALKLCGIDKEIRL